MGRESGASRRGPGEHLLTFAVTCLLGLPAPAHSASELCRWLLDVSPGFVAAVEQARGLPVRGYIPDEERAATEQWLATPEAAALFASAQSVKRITLQNRPPERNFVSEPDYQRAAEATFPSPSEYPDPAAVPLTDKEVGVLWTSNFVRELLLISPDLQRDAGRLIQRTYNPERGEDRVDFLAELMRPKNVTTRNLLTLWVRVTEFRYIHTQTPPDIARVRVLAAIANKEYQRAFAPARSRRNESDAAKGSTPSEVAFTRAAGIPLAHLKKMTAELTELSERNFRIIQRQEPFSTQSLEEYLKKFVTVTLNFLGAAKNSIGNDAVQAQVRQLVRELIIETRVDRMSYAEFRDLEPILTYSAQYRADFEDARRRLLAFAGPF